MFKSKKISIISLIIAISLLASCTGIETGQNDLPQKEMITVVDSLGQEVIVPKESDNIAALYSFAGYTCSMLGRGDDLVAVPGGLKRDVFLTELFPKIKDAAVPRSGGTINIEELINAKPDVVIIRGDTAADDREKEKLDKTNIPYIVVEFSTIEGQQEAIQIIGKAIGREEEAEKFIDYYDDVIQRVGDIIGDIPEDERVRVYHSENQALRTTHKDTVSADWAAKAGFINVSVGEDLELSGNDYYANIEQVLLWDPEVIIANEMSAVHYIKGHPHWSGVEAVKEGRVYKLPQGISRWGHPGSIETPLALLWVVKTIYPEQSQEIDMAEEIRYFYDTFFGINLDDDMVQTIIDGEDLRKPKGED